MASILTIEDGTGVAGANSYVSAATIRSYAVNHGVTLPAAGTGVDPVEILAIKAMDYLESFRAEYQGAKSDSEQDLQFPRTGVYIDGVLSDDDELPSCLLNAQCQLAIDANTTALLPTGDRRQVISESYANGALARTFSPGAGGSPKPRLTAADALIAPLLTSATVGGWLRTVRL